MKIVLFSIGAVAVVWAIDAALNPWALHIGGHSTPLLYWHGTGTVVAKNGKAYPLYLYFFPGKPMRNGGGRREGKRWSADLKGSGSLCVAPGTTEQMQLSGTMYGGYLNTDNSLFEFRVLEWRKAFQINPQNRGFFDVAGMFHGPDLVMDRPGEQGIKFKSGLLIDNATVTLHWANSDEFEAACRSMGGAPGR